MYAHLSRIDVRARRLDRTGSPRRAHRRDRRRDRAAPALRGPRPRRRGRSAARAPVPRRTSPERRASSRAPASTCTPRATGLSFVHPRSRKRAVRDDGERPPEPLVAATSRVALFARTRGSAAAAPPARPPVPDRERRARHAAASAPRSRCADPHLVERIRRDRQRRRADAAEALESTAARDTTRRRSAAFAHRQRDRLLEEVAVPARSDVREASVAEHARRDRPLRRRVVPSAPRSEIQ